MLTIFLIISLVLIIFIHELSHLTIACLVGKKPKILSVGLWKPYISIRIKGIQFRLTPFILGGFVSFTDNFNNSMEEVKKLSLYKQLYIYTSGCFGNIISGILLIGFCCWYLFRDFTLLFTFINENLILFYSVMTMVFTDTITSINIDTLFVFIDQIANINNITIRFAIIGSLLFGSLSFITGLINLIPIPPIDGWHIVQGIIEKVRGRNFSYKTNLALTYFGISFVVVFNLYIIFYAIFNSLK